MLSHRWFDGFCKRYRISLLRKTYEAQKSPAALSSAIEKFHAKSLRERNGGIFTFKDLGKMDQTLLPCVMDDKRTYESTGADEVWIPSGQSGLERRQCTAQLTIFVCESALLPLLIFHGKWLQINPTEKNNDIAKLRSSFNQRHGVMKRS